MTKSTSHPVQRTEGNPTMATSRIENISGIVQVYEVKRRSVSLTRPKSTWAERQVTIESTEEKNGSCQAILHYTRPSKSAFRVRELEKQVVFPCSTAATLRRLDRRTCAQRSAPSAFCLELTLPPLASSAPTSAKPSISKVAAAREAKVALFSFVDASTLEQWERALRAAGCSSDSWTAAESFRGPMQGPSTQASGDSSAGWESEPFGGSSASSTSPYLHADSSYSASPRTSPSSSSSSSGGTAAFVPQVPFMPADVVPTRYLVDAKSNKEEAQRRWAATHAFRKELSMDEALTEEWPHMEALKDEYRHCFHNRAKSGHVVYYDRLDLATMSRILDRPNSLSATDLIRYYLFVTDYCYQELEPDDPGGRQVTVYDLSRITLSSLVGSATEPVKQIIRLYAVHYPERVDKVFLVNAPYFFTGIWASIKMFLDPAVVSRISISTNGRAELFDYIGQENVPSAYGGTDPVPLGESEEELKFRAHVLRNRRDAADERAAAAAQSSGEVCDSAAEGDTSRAASRVAGDLVVPAETVAPTPVLPAEGDPSTKPLKGEASVKATRVRRALRALIAVRIPMQATALMALLALWTIAFFQF